MAGNEPSRPGSGSLTRIRSSHRWPSRWPIRWKLAAVSAGLTFFILIAFGLAVGQLTTGQLRDNYAAETTAKGEELVGALQRASEQGQIAITPTFVYQPDRLQAVLASVSGEAELILIANGTVYNQHGYHRIALTGYESGITTSGGLQVVTLPFPDPDVTEGAVVAVRYGRSLDRLDASVQRIWLSILAGTFGATLLAALGGVMLSRRAMRPISNLTRAAGQIAKTRDPEITLEQPHGEDEVAELTRTFRDMLHELSLSRAERERLLARQREFVADASHELRTPLTSVQANLELLEHSIHREEGSGDEVESLESALRSSRRMGRLVADLQTLARMDSRQISVFRRCDISRIATDATAELRPLAPEQRILLEAPDQLFVDGNRDDLHRAILNLINNAISHIPPGATITVRTAAGPEDGSGQIIVSDDGPGIPEPMRDQVFERFVRNAGPGDRARGKGTGLGLAIVQAISESHGGTAVLTESPQGGAEFRITLPLTEETGPDQGDVTSDG